MNKQELKNQLSSLHTRRQQLQYTKRMLENKTRQKLSASEREQFSLKLLSTIDSLNEVLTKDQDLQAQINKFY